MKGKAVREIRSWLCNSTSTFSKHKFDAAEWSSYLLHRLCRSGADTPHVSACHPDLLSKQNLCFLDFTQGSIKLHLDLIGRSALGNSLSPSLAWDVFGAGNSQVLRLKWGKRVFFSFKPLNGVALNLLWGSLGNVWDCLQQPMLDFHVLGFPLPDQVTPNAASFKSERKGEKSPRGWFKEIFRSTRTKLKIAFSGILGALWTEWSVFSTDDGT